jgi:DNA-binding CsgD family transcriptional regulator
MAKQIDQIAISSRERTVLTLMANGMTRAEMARRLNIKPPTLDTYTQRLSDAFRTAQRGAMIRSAAKAGIWKRCPVCRQPLKQTTGERAM